MSSSNEIIKSLNTQSLRINEYGNTGIGVSVPEKIKSQEAVRLDNGEYVLNDVESDNPTKDPNVIKTERVTELENTIDAYEDSASILDRKILAANDAINAKKLEIVNIVTDAIGAGCSYIYAIPSSQDPLIFDSVTIGLGRTVYSDQAQYKAYNNLSNFSARNPFDTDSENTLSSSTLGSGYQTITSNNDGSSVGLAATIPGTLLLGGASSTCAGYASSIDSIAAEIVTLRTERDSYISNVNTLKDGKLDEEILYWGEKNSDEKRVGLTTNAQNLANNIASIPDI